ncbi:MULTISPECIES: cytochrome C oxidase subunit IV family protein [Sphingobium]|uniref:Cytochrome C oxidase subunit IV n=2 Tax=Sphingobium cupriresistens TaxID=1132417 RepID=A0A0J7XN08_9SPHN|nr:MULTISPECIES: cytochrome C oxidase subunit IV family protein [Sphingobium]KMS52999.1 hypothetical protein V473_18570 [Sphingobium cupriresistens LL01]MBJ7375911.1 cytochrome C oxidase subunit IV family protein [Sphingobium sp.]RYM11956.1 hypothetical protein EWH12_07810 [Sphingobium cupriresistens]WCP15421.1 hypothetical protein sphantq_03882 [Sphingobium sp. AntQ-1]
MSRRLTLIWALLVAATLLSFETMGLGDARIGGALILLLAFAKVLLVGREFMELRHAPLMLLWLFQGWVAVTGAALACLLIF